MATKAYGALTPYAVKELASFIHGTGAKRSILLLGPPGIGKSVLVREIAQEIARDQGRVFLEYKRQHIAGIDLEQVFANPERYFVYVDLRLTEAEPVDLMGRPVTVTIRDRKQIVYHPPQWAVLLAELPGVLFLDELTNIQRPDVLAAAYKLIQDRAAGFTGFSPGVQVISAGNRPEDSSIANLLPAPLLNRVYRIEVEPPTVNQWVRWVSTQYDRCDEKVFAYLYRFPDDFCRVPEEGETLEGYPTPRSYTFLANDLVAAVEAGLKPSIIRTLCIAALGSEVGERLFAFWQNPVPGFTEFLDNPSLFQELNLDQRYIAVVVIGQGLAETVFKLAASVPEEQEIPAARVLIEPNLRASVQLLDIIGAENKEYLALLWFILSNRLHAPWNDALYLELCAQSQNVKDSYASVGNLLR
ncbi:MAG: ATP-binding protein [Firmicutes bacterium]|nr:ATP-binding protein [Bacillota bacterium]MBV1727129.1 ATP-binding protein [Desulforudis sp.]MBU4532300.1 ATP-binding protein [Bacillota bacterium]MBU4554179.1 ATP-binding protein [Bacillota bacterium]MBV1735677.1 ATP-binding protein [Desulforudis sp.]